jgi:hypothetical protein
MGPIRCDHAAGLVARDLIQQVGQHGRRVTHPAAGDLARPDSQRFRVNPKVNLVPVAWFPRPVIPGKPFSIAFGFHTGGGVYRPSENLLMLQRRR